MEIDGCIRSFDEDECAEGSHVAMLVLFLPEMIDVLEQAEPSLS